MTPEPKRPKETVRQGEVPESNAPPGESLGKKKVRFSTEPGDGSACAITVEEQLEDYWSDEHGQGELFEGLRNKLEPDVDTAATEAALDRLLANGVVRDTPWKTRNTKCVSLDANACGRRSVRIFSLQELHTALDALWTFSRSSGVCQPSLWIARMPFIRRLS